MPVELNTLIRVLWDNRPNNVWDVADEYGEPGYHADGPIIIGYWWCECENGPEEGEEKKRSLHGVEYHYPRVFAALEEAKAEFEWSDEWYVSHSGGSSKAYRTQADNYAWQSSLLWCEDVGDYLTPDDGLEAWLEVAVNNPRVALPSHLWTDAELEEVGFREYQCDYESGWYGREDNPETITELLRDREGEELDILFKLSDVGQFHVRWCVYVRHPEDHPED